jgi:hypothetical protein
VSDFAAAQQAYIPVTREILADAGLLPAWETPDRNPMPRFVPFPRLAAAQVALDTVRDRAHQAFDVLRGTKVAAPPDYLEW